MKPSLFKAFYVAQMISSVLWLLRSVDWYLVSDVWGLPRDLFSRKVGDKLPIHTALHPTRTKI
jgi:hypothetical protein